MEHIAPIVNLFGINFDLSIMIMIVVTSAIVLFIAISGSRKSSVNEISKFQNFMEWVAEFVENIIGSTLGSKHKKAFLGLGMTLIMYIFIGNMLGLPFSILTSHDVSSQPNIAGIAFVSEEALLDAADHGHDSVHVLWWKSPTADIAVTAGLAVLVILLSHYLGLTRNRKHYLKHYFEPYPVLFPLNIVKEVSKPLTLSLRLYGNIYAGEVMISVIVGISFFGIVPLFVWQGFSIFVGSIQAFIFTMLTMVYISQAMIHEETH
jgi:F-type H+-transporting ATPase subunit a